MIKKLIIYGVAAMALTSCAGLDSAISNSQSFMYKAERVMNYPNTMRSSFKSTSPRRPIYKVNETVGPRNWSINTNQTGGTSIPMCPGTRPNGGK